METMKYSTISRIKYHTIQNGEKVVLVIANVFTHTSTNTIPKLTIKIFVNYSKGSLVRIRTYRDESTTYFPHCSDIECRNAWNIQATALHQTWLLRSTIIFFFSLLFVIDRREEKHTFYQSIHDRDIPTELQRITV